LLRRHVTQVGGPGTKIGAVLLGQGTPGRKFHQGLAFAFEMVVQCVPTSGREGHLEEHLERFSFGLPYGVPIEQVRGAATFPQWVGQALNFFALVRVEADILRNVLDPYVEGAGVTTTDREVGRGFQRWKGFARVHRVDECEVGPEVSSTPVDELGEITQVTHPPGGTGPHAVHLCHDPPGTAPRVQGRGVDPLGDHEQGRGVLLPAHGGPERVYPQGQFWVEGQYGTVHVFDHTVCPVEPHLVRGPALPYHHRGWWGPLVRRRTRVGGVDPQCLQDGPKGVRSDLDLSPLPILVTRRDAVLFGHPGQLNISHRKRSCPTRACSHGRSTRSGGQN